MKNNYIGAIIQILKMLMHHIFTAVTGAFFCIMGMIVFLNKTLPNEIIAVLFLGLYFIVLYVRAGDCARYDKKTYTPTKAHPLKGFILPIGIIVCYIILFRLYSLSWKYQTPEGMIATGWGKLLSVAYVIYTYMYARFATIAQGAVSIWVHFMAVLVPLAASVLGYIAGFKNFSVYDKLLSLMYEKK